MFSLFLFLPFLISSVKPIQPFNDRPIIGIVAEDLWHKNGTTQIFASYVKFIESAGARVVPIWIYQSADYYENLLNNINGVLFPGGANELQGEGYGRTGRIIFDIASKMNDKGEYFPLWGTCLGFEMLTFLAANKKWFKSCHAEDLATPVGFINDFRNSKLFKNTDDSLVNSVKSERSVVHYHQWCITPQNFTKSGLDKYFKVLALNQDKENLTFVSIIEARKYPFYGVSFHPEKSMFEFVLTKTHQNTVHSYQAIKISQYFANFFVQEARKSKNHFSNQEAERETLIFNYNPTYTAKDNPVEQIYFFQH